MDNLTDKKLMCLIDRLIDEKILKDEKFLRFTFFEVRIKGKVTNEEENDFLRLAKTKLNNMGYIVYLQEQEFIDDDARRKVQPNELMIAIK